jgi:hypothetical protein
MKTPSKWLLLSSLITCLTLSVGCTSDLDTGPSEPASSSEGAETARLELTTDVLADTDLGGVRYTVTQVDCNTGDPIVPGYTESVDVDLADMYIPGGNGTFEDTPYDADSQHLFADQYFDLAPGCYDVLVEPLQANGDLSRDCWSAHRNAVEVFASSTTELLLIMQCRGEDNGGLDVIATANHPPRIDDLQFEPSKFTCEERTRVCLTISDPDSDPLDVAWNVGPGAQVTATSQQTGDDGQIVACATIQSSTPGSYDVTATVFDLGYNANGDLVAIEELLIAQGDPHPSRATLSFPIHMISGEDCIDDGDNNDVGHNADAGQPGDTGDDNGSDDAGGSDTGDAGDAGDDDACDCPDGYTVNAAGDGCENLEVVAPNQTYLTFNVCSGDTNDRYSKLGAKYPNGYQETNAFFGQTWTTSDGRLNDIGVWGCPGALPGGSSYPGEWIGFSTCIDAPSDGEYIIGIAADNRVRFHVDGTLEFTLDNDNVENFENWWMIPISLTAGPHVIELEGFNDGGDAAFGADIYGPFPAGSLPNDAAMAAADVENNIIFSTANMLGQQFEIGSDSGFSCPDGYFANSCGPTLECTRLLEVECLPE